MKKDGKYLMLHRNKNKRIMPDVWMGPGGKREHTEGLFACARREVKEETGLDIKNLRIMSTGCAYLEDLQQELFFHFIEAEYAGGDVLQHPEDGDLVWLTPEEIGTLDNLLSETKKILPYLFRDGPVFSYRAVYGAGNTLKEFAIEDPQK